MSLELIAPGLVVAGRLANLRLRIGGLALGRARRLAAAGKRRRARAWLLLVGVISWYDLTRALARSRVSLTIQVVGLVLAVVGLVVWPAVGISAWAVAASGLATAVAGFGIEVQNLRRDDAKFTITSVARDPSFQRRVRSCARHSGEVVRVRDHLAVHSEAVDADLARQSRIVPASGTGGIGPSDRITMATWTSHRRPMHPEILPRRRQLLLNKYGQTRPFDGQLVAQCTTLDEATLASGIPVDLGRTTYFDLMCSNYLVDSIVELDQQIEVDGAGLMLDRGQLLRRFEDSELSDAIGASTLAFDTRNRLILIEQSEHALSSAGLWAPSGSGSLEPRDILVTPWGDAAVPLVNAIRVGMNRELVEEANISPRMIVDSRIIGFARWLDKGAKPEYFGVTLLRAPVDQLKRSMFETRWVKRIIGVDVDLARLCDHPEAPDRCLGPTREKAQSYARRMSMPLYLSLRALGRRLGDDDEFRSWFFRTDRTAGGGAGA